MFAYLLYYFFFSIFISTIILCLPFVAKITCLLIAATRHVPGARPKTPFSVYLEPTERVMVAGNVVLPAGRS